MGHFARIVCAQAVDFNCSKVVPQALPASFFTRHWDPSIDFPASGFCLVHEFLVNPFGYRMKNPSRCHHHKNRRCEPAEILPKQVVGAPKAGALNFLVIFFQVDQWFGLKGRNDKCIQAAVVLANSGHTVSEFWITALDLDVEFNPVRKFINDLIKKWQGFTIFQAYFGQIVAIERRNEALCVNGMAQPVIVHDDGMAVAAELNIQLNATRPAVDGPLVGCTAVFKGFAVGAAMGDDFQNALPAFESTVCGGILINCIFACHAGRMQSKHPHKILHHLIIVPKFKPMENKFIKTGIYLTLVAMSMAVWQELHAEGRTDLPIWAKENTVVQQERNLRVVCSGRGPSVDQARTYALRSCKSAAADFLQNDLTVRGLTVESEGGVAIHQEIEGRAHFKGLFCKPLRDYVRSLSDGLFEVWLRCEFDLTKVEQTNEQREGIEPQVNTSRGLDPSQKLDLVKQRELEVDDGGRRPVPASLATVLDVISIPPCETLIIRGLKSRPIKCSAGGITSATLDAGDFEIIVRASGYLSKRVRISPGGKRHETVQVILDAENQ